MFLEFAAISRLGQVRPEVHTLRWGTSPTATLAGLSQCAGEENKYHIYMYIYIYNMSMNARIFLLHPILT